MRVAFEVSPKLDDRDAISRDDVEELGKRWTAARRLGPGLPPYEEVMLGQLGHLADRMLLATRAEAHWIILRAGRSVPEWFGRDTPGSRFESLSPDCELALTTACRHAMRDSWPRSSQTHCARNGFVQRYEFLAMPLANRWGEPIVAVYIGERGTRYSLVDAIFRSTEEGVIALAALRDDDDLPIDFQVVDLNDGAAQLLKSSAADIRWRLISEGHHAFNSPEVLNKLRNVVVSRAKDTFEIDLLLSGAETTLRIGLTSMGDLICVSLADITDLKKRERSSRLLFENNPLPMWIVDVDTARFLNVNDAALAHYGFERAAFLDMSMAQLMGARIKYQSATIAEMCGIGMPSKSWCHVKADATEIEVLTFGRDLRVDERKAYLVAMVDITERKRAEAKIAHLAHHDSLTGLPNRAFYRESLGRILGDADTRKTAVLYLDLDFFKNVNDSFGHPVGDRLLQLVSARLREALGDRHLVARLGGDEFGVVLCDMESSNQASEIAGLLIESLKRPYEVDGLEVSIGASVGIAIAPADGSDADEILKNADMALYRAKSEGPGLSRFFEIEMDRSAQRRRALEANLKSALAAGELELHYQPLIDLELNRVTSFEGLIRWRHQGAFIPPSEFIPLAETTGLISSIGEWVLRTACSAAVDWPSHIDVAVNLSPAQFRDKNLAQIVLHALASSGLEAARLHLEITESVLLGDTQENVDMLRQLKSFGVHVSMDDFGTGYSSLSYLRSFPFDKIKIDRSFVADVAHKPDSMAIIGAVSAMARRLGMRTTAEGVESAEQLECVRLQGCTEVQGYYFSAARPKNEIADLIRAIDGRMNVAA